MILYSNIKKDSTYKLSDFVRKKCSCYYFIELRSKLADKHKNISTLQNDVSVTDERTDDMINSVVYILL